MCLWLQRFARFVALNICSFCVTVQERKGTKKKNLTGLTRRLKPLEAGYVTQVVF